MKRKRLWILLSLLSVIIAYALLLPGFRYMSYEPEEGDMIFQSLPRMDLVDAIEGVTKSPYSHCGLLLKKEDGWYVREALGYVIDTPLWQWIWRGRGFKFSVYRLKPDYKSAIPQFIEKSEAYLGLIYDSKYEMDDYKIYCSELLYKSYIDATGVKLSPLVTLGSMNWKPYTNTIKNYEGGEPPLEREMIPPLHLSQSIYIENILNAGF